MDNGFAKYWSHCLYGLADVSNAHFRFVIPVNNVVPNEDGVGASQYSDLAW